MSAKKRGVLMVCLGNICRSPIAEAVFLDEVRKRGEQDKWFADSCGTIGYHTGNTPDHRARATMKRHNVPMDHRARVLTEDDFTTYDFIFGMDNANVRDITEEAPANSTAVVEMLGDYDPEGKAPIADPYYDRGDAGFELAYTRCVRCVNAFLDKLKEQNA